MPDVAKHSDLGLEFLQAHGNLLFRMPDGHSASVLQQRLVYRPVPARFKDFRFSVQQVFQREPPPVEVHDLSKLR